MCVSFNHLIEKNFFLFNIMRRKVTIHTRVAENPGHFSNAHIPSHPACHLFHAAQSFDPKFILLGPLERKNLHQYRSIKELENPSDELLNEWAIYCGMRTDDLIGEIDLNEYWINIQDQLPILSEIALEYIWLPISSCSVERSFSIYNNILDSNRQNLSETSLKTLNMMYYNSS